MGKGTADFNPAIREMFLYGLSPGGRVDRHQAEPKGALDRLAGGAEQNFHSILWGHNRGTKRKQPLNIFTVKWLLLLVRPTGFEPVAYGLEVRFFNVHSISHSIPFI